MPDPSAQPERPAEPPVEGRDYYMDGPWLVFTREYHLRRGYCCQSGCRHCPWGYRKPSPTSDIQHNSATPPVPDSSR